MKFQFKPNYFIIPLIVIAVAVIGSLFSTSGMEWYRTSLIRPEITPPNYVFPIAWNTIFILTTISAIIYWNKGHQSKFLWFDINKKPTQRYWWIYGLFIANALLNVAWSLLFFTLHLIGPALVEMLILLATIIAIITLGWNISKKAALLLYPYAIWVTFATFLTLQIWLLN